VIAVTLPSSDKVATLSIDRGTFENLYAGIAPWEIGKPQRHFAAICDQVTSPILDAGCGTGENALMFASLGHRVIGIDFVAEAIHRARRKASKRSLSAEFLVKDALTLCDWSGRFRTVLDSGMFHVFSNDDRRRYVQGLTEIVEPGGRLYLLCFSDQEPGTDGPRRVSRQELHDAFADHWEVESVQPVQVEVNPQVTEVKFSDGGPRAWFAVVRRQG
jgi:cyclopropane fatty-acyl-phospholipid synthase-like methyltransferase